METTNFWKTVFLLIVKNWKTTATGLTTAILWLIKLFFPDLGITDEFAGALTAFLVSLGFLFSKDGNKTGL